MKNKIKNGMLACVLGYLMIIISVLILSIVIKLITGYYPSFVHFTAALITLRLFEISQILLIAPLLSAIITFLLLSRIQLDERIVIGFSMTSYYLLIGTIFIIAGSDEFPLFIILIWVFWVFVIGLASLIIVNKLIKD